VFASLEFCGSAVSIQDFITSPTQVRFGHFVGFYHSQLNCILDQVNGHIKKWEQNTVVSQNNQQIQDKKFHSSTKRSISQVIIVFQMHL
jgi:hypothetical protein